MKIASSVPVKAVRGAVEVADMLVGRALVGRLVEEEKVRGGSWFVKEFATRTDVVVLSCAMTVADLALVYCFGC